MEEIFWNFEIGSRELAYKILTRPYNLGVKGTKAREFKYFILV
jgi:hypothetical protein